MFVKLSQGQTVNFVTGKIHVTSQNLTIQKLPPLHQGVVSRVVINGF